MMPAEHAPLAHAQQSELVKFTSCILVRLQLWGTAAGHHQHLEAPRYKKRMRGPAESSTLLPPQQQLLPRTGVSAAFGLELLLEAFRSVQPYHAGHAPWVVQNVLCAVAWNGH